MKKAGKIILFACLAVICIIIANKSFKSFLSGSNSSSKSNSSSSSSSTVSISKSSCVEVDYEDVARNPTKYKTKQIVISGTIIQVIESSSNKRQYRVAEKGNYDNVWLVTYDSKGATESRLLDNDEVTIYGICAGTTTYKSVLGQEITVPAMKGVIIENHSVKTTAAEMTASPAVDDTDTTDPADSTFDETNALTPDTSVTDTIAEASSEFKAALEKAKSYSENLNYSKQRIYDQLISIYEQFPPEAAQYAVDNLDVDFRLNALEKAKSYRSLLSYSNKRIYEQLLFDEFTAEEAQYAIDHLE